VTLKRGQHSKYPPYAFTEHGILMLSSILKSERAEKINIMIIDTFIKLREMMGTHESLLNKMQELQQHISSHDQQIVVLFEYLKKLLSDKENKKDQVKRKRIGFKNID
jgi:phage regulator Rha-like protein